MRYYIEGKGGPIDTAIIGSSKKIIELLIANGAKQTPNSLNVVKFTKRAEVVKLIEEIEK